MRAAVEDSRCGGGNGGGASRFDLIAGFGGGTDNTDAICAMGGRTPAMPWPVIMACVYEGCPNPEANANAPFWQSPVAVLVKNTITKTNARYTPAETSRKYVVDIESSANTSVFITNASPTRFVYDLGA